jgi:hypothetical protein
MQLHMDHANRPPPGHGVPGHYAPCRSSRGQLGELDALPPLAFFFCGHLPPLARVVRFGRDEICPATVSNGGV